MLKEKKETLNIFEKKEYYKFEKVGLIQTLKIWSRETHQFLRKKLLINSLIKQKDFSTLFELINNNYNFSKSENKKINKELNNALIERTYEEKFGLIETLEKYKIEINDEKYYYLLISNVFNNSLKDFKKNKISENKKTICEKILHLLEDKKFKEGLHEFIVKDIENRPRDFGGGINWSMNRDVYYEPGKSLHLFEGMSKSQFKRIINSEIGSLGILNEYVALANNAPIDIEVLNELGIDTKSLVEKAQKSLLLKEESLTEEMKEKINNISKNIEKIQNTENIEYKEVISKIIEETLPNVIKKYLSIDEEYRETLKNIEGKYPSQLLLESLENIDLQVNDINREINEEKVSHLSIETRKLKK